MQSLKGDRGDNRLLPRCWFSKLVIEGENECLPLLYYRRWDALEQCSKPWLQLRAFRQKTAEFTAKVFRMNESYARKQNQEVVKLNFFTFRRVTFNGRRKFGGHSRTCWRDYNNKGLMHICHNRSVSGFHRNVQRMRLRIKMPKWENEYGDNPSNNDGLFRRNPVLCVCVCVFPHMFIIKKNKQNMRRLLIHGCKNKLPAVCGEIRVMEKLVFLTNGVCDSWGIVLLC